MAAAIETIDVLEQAKIIEEKNLYRSLKEYFENATDLKICGLGHCLGKDNFMFAAYSERDWEQSVCENFSVTVNNKYNEMVSNNFGQEAKWVKCIVTEGEMWSYRVTIASKHSENLHDDDHYRVDIYT